MPVIINDFEIIAEPPPAPQAAGPAQSATESAQPPALHPEDVVRIERHEQQRRERVRAD
jgi:hypothetical protein